jgi:hypothetical protein
MCLSHHLPSHMTAAVAQSTQIKALEAMLSARKAVCKLPCHSVRLLRNDRINRVIFDADAH